ncbi:hypothetical protein BDV59DRAFT_205245 [Aspergillus ambiguus]|uniref:uncharacterized protein n=1 Tax=Aspergillus ambiguus TaxID=176160 RepID=UPI003CCDE6B1
MNLLKKLLFRKYFVVAPGMASIQQAPPCRKCGGTCVESGSDACPPDFCIPCSQTSMVQSSVPEVPEAVYTDSGSNPASCPAIQEYPELSQGQMKQEEESEEVSEAEEARLIQEDWAHKKHEYMRSVLNAPQPQANDNELPDVVPDLQEVLVSTAWMAPAQDLPALNQPFPSPVLELPPREYRNPAPPSYPPASPTYAPQSPPHVPTSHAPKSPSYHPESPVFYDYESVSPKTIPQSPVYHPKSPTPEPDPEYHDPEPPVWREVSYGPRRSTVSYEPQSPVAPSAAPPSHTMEAPSPAPKRSEKRKMTPACANCKRSKIRCVHRRAIDDNGNLGPEVPAASSKKRKRAAEPASSVATQGENDDSANQPPHKRVLRIRAPKKLGDDEVVPATQPQVQPEPKEEGRKPRGRPRKRKVVVFEENADTNEEVNHPPAKRGRKSKSKGDNTAGGDEPKSLEFLASMEDSIEGASFLAMHNVLSRELDEKLTQCQTSLQSTIDSIHNAKRILDTWVEVWTKQK